MAEYDFTIRATDNLGAYSDRTFTIEVRNTNVERYVMLTQSGVFHSATAAAGSWKHESNVTGRALAYGDGQWVAYGTTNAQGSQSNTRYFVSSDAVNWVAVDMSYNMGEFAQSRSSFILNEIQSLKYVNGSWTMFTLHRWVENTGTRHGSHEFTSSDLKNWTWVRAIGVEVLASNFDFHEGIYDFDYNPTTDQWIALSSIPTSTGGTTRIYRRTGAAGWGGSIFWQTGVGTDTIRPYTVSVNNLNGQWVVNLGGSDVVGVAISTNGNDWARKPIGNGQQSSSNLIYSNGYLIRCSKQIPGTNINTALCSRSTNGGRDWTYSSTTYPATTTSVVVGKNATAYGNICIVSAGVSGQISVSRNSGATWEQQNILDGSTSAGTIFSVMARPD